MRTAAIAFGVIILAVAGCTLFRPSEGPPETVTPVTATHGVAAPAHPHCLHGCPVGTAASNALVSRDAYTLSSNKIMKFSDWTAYKVTSATLGESGPRNWKSDPDIDSADTLEPEDYRGAHAALGTDRGHQAPLASLSAFANGVDTNFLSNITPQKSALNRGPWQRLEAAERRLIEEGAANDVRVLTGPLYERDMPVLPGADEPHRIPSGYWKVIAVESGDGLRTVAFIMDQETPAADDFCSHTATIDEIEERAGLDLFPNVEDDAFEGQPGVLAEAVGC